MNEKSGWMARLGLKGFGKKEQPEESLEEEEAPATVPADVSDVSPEPSVEKQQLELKEQSGADGSRSWFQRLKDGLSKSSQKLTTNIKAIFRGGKLDDEMLEELEDSLVTADIGVETSAYLASKIADNRFGKEVSDLEIREALAQEITTILKDVARKLPQRREARPQVILIAGVNGVGKTTTIGKLARQQIDQGKRVILAACDTFRAAAVEQLEVWGERNNTPVLKAAQGADPAGLAFDAYQRAVDENYDVLLIDTAGRLQNKQHLMEELAKILRVLRKKDENVPHDIILVVDATTGQNVHNQIEAFQKMIEINGIIVTKLDGTAKGGVVVAVAQRFGLPIYAVGVGENVEDLRDFDPEFFAKSLLGLEHYA